jgi:hypothetical protein
MMTQVHTNYRIRTPLLGQYSPVTPDSDSTEEGISKFTDMHIELARARSFNIYILCITIF